MYDKETKDFPVHRVVLANQSSFFYKLFYDKNFMEANKTRIHIQAPLLAFEKTLKFIYTAKISLEYNNLDELLQILELAHRFELKILEATLIDEAGSQATAGNLRELIQAARLMNLNALKEKCYQTIGKNGTAFLASKNFMNLKEEDILEILGRLSFRASNIDKFIAISKWLKAHPSMRKDYLLNLVNLSKLTNDQIIQIVLPTNLYSIEKLILSRGNSIQPEDLNRPIIQISQFRSPQVIYKLKNLN